MIKSFIQPALGVPMKSLQIPKNLYESKKILKNPNTEGCIMERRSNYEVEQISAQRTFNTCVITI